VEVSYVGQGMQTHRLALGIGIRHWSLVIGHNPGTEAKNLKIATPFAPSLLQLFRSTGVAFARQTHTVGGV
jgi:hypothetical protein